jgi:oligopeptide/dipeptide ABC transporter ATP-binding protein
MTLTSGARAEASTPSHDRDAVRIEHVVKQFTVDGPIVLDDVSLDVRPGEFVSLVGASGCGKSTLLNLIAGLDTQTSGVIETSGPPSLMFQESALMPWLTAGKNVELALLFRGVPARQRKAKARELMALVHLDRSYYQRPHELSGGMRQRVMIAMALSCRPELVIADEPTTALDVTIQAQILDLIRQLKAETGTSVILITHDLGVVAGMTDRLVVMYAGKIFETGSTEAIFARPANPYTRGLLLSVPDVTAVDRGDLYQIRGLPPDVAHLPPGCPFAPRCDRAEARCRETPPPMVEVAPGHVSLCHFADEVYATPAGRPVAAGSR